MQNELDNEQWTVAIKVLTGNGKYREYRLPKSLSTDRSSLWSTKHEVGKRIAEILKQKKQKIVDLKRSIKQIEKSQSNWQFLAKCVNERNEHFFLDALLASEEDIEKFEKENFFSGSSWTKLRDVVELTDEQLHDLKSFDSEENLSDENQFEQGKTCKARHYDWICNKAEALTTSKPDTSEQQKKKSESRETTSNGCTEKRQACSEEKEKEESDKFTIATVLNGNQDDRTDPSKFSEPKAHSVLVEEDLQGMDASLTKNGCALPEESIKICDSTSEKSAENGTHHSIDSDIQSTVESQSSGQDSTRASESTHSSENGKDITDLTTHSNGISTGNRTMSMCSTSSSTSQTKKQLADPSGFSRLRLTSGTSFDTPPVLPTPTVQKSGNIWEQRAAEREEKLTAKKKNICSSTPVVAPVKSFFISENPIATPIKTEQNSSARKHPATSANPKKGLNNTSASVVDSNGWITFAAKKGNRTSSFLRNLEQQEASAKATTSMDSSAEETDDHHVSATAKLSTTVMKHGDKIQDQTLGGKSEQFEEKCELSEAEKRAKRRQRVQEKAKQSARQKQEEEKRVKEQKRIERELRIESEKKEKELKQRLDYEKRKRDIESVKKERELKQRKKANIPESNRIQEMLKSKDRMEEHVKEKELPYRMIGSKVYIDKRIPELQRETAMEINRSKLQILEKYKKRISALETMNCFMVFISYRLVEKCNRFKLEELLDYLDQKNGSTSGENSSPNQFDIKAAYETYYHEKKPKLAECMIKGMQFADSVLYRINKLDDKSVSVEKTKQVLNRYKEMYNEAVHYMSITSYLLTRTTTEFFVVEEDYLLTVTENESCEKQRALIAEQEQEDENDEDDFEKPEVQDMCCQTEGEPYDIRAASYLPRED